MRSWKKSPDSMRIHVKVRKSHYFSVFWVWNVSVMSCHAINYLDKFYIFVL